MQKYPLPRWLFVVALFVLVALGVALANLSAASRTVTIRDGGQSRSLQTSAATVAGALSAADLAVYPEDLVQPPLSSALGPEQTISIQRAFPVEIAENGVSTLIRTRQTRVSAILAEAGKTVGPADAVYLDGRQVAAADLDTIASVPLSILIQRPVAFKVASGGTEQALSAGAWTVGDALAGAGFSLFVADGLQPGPDALLSPGLAIQVVKSVPVSLEVDGRKLQTRTHFATVAQVLAAAGVSILGQDYVVPGLSEAPPADASPIRVVRVVDQIQTETKPLTYETQFQANADLEIDNTQVTQAGAYGTTATRVRIRLENGQEVSRTPEDTWVAVAPRPQIISYGTKIVLRTVDTPDGPLTYWRALRMYATSYSASRSGTPPSAAWYGHTRSGKTLTIGMAAIDLRVMPLGTQLYVPDYGHVSAEDTGGGVRGKMIDLGYDDWNFINWHQFTLVYFLAPVPPADQIKWVIP